MAPKITLTEVSASSVVYDHYTRLFPFSPRREIDQDLVERLKRSITETGMWMPVVVQAGTMEGIAGNHRFLAYWELAPVAFPPRVNGLTIEQLHHQVDRAVLGYVVVIDLDGAGVLDRVGDVALPEKPLPDGGLERKLRVEHLQGGLLPVAVGGRVYRPHPADTDQPVHGPLAADYAAHALLGSLD